MRVFVGKRDFCLCVRGGAWRKESRKGEMNERKACRKDRINFSLLRATDLSNCKEIKIKFVSKIVGLSLVAFDHMTAKMNFNSDKSVQK